MIPTRRPHLVIRRRPGEYAPDGLWRPALEPRPETLMLGIQPASPADYARLQADGSGRRVAEMLRAYGSLGDEMLQPAGEGGHAGDLVLHNGHRFVVIGRAIRDILGSPVSHVRYLLAREVEAAPGEVMA